MWIDDQVIVNCQHPLSMEVWVPDKTLVVLGSSNKPDRECYVEHCVNDDIPILKRRGGGGAVVLHSGAVVLSIGAWVRDRFNNGDFFSRINTAVMNTIRHLSPKLSDMCQKGISDLTIGDRKFAGTSLFRSRNYLLYQASILVETELSLIDRYLRHPSLEPGYRKKKSHGDFLIGLGDLDSSLTTLNLVKMIKLDFMSHFESSLKDQLIGPMNDQCHHLLKRVDLEVAH